MNQPYRGDFLKPEEIRNLLENYSHTELRAMLEQELNVSAACDISLLLSFKRPVERISAMDDAEVTDDHIEMYFSAKNQLRRSYRSGMSAPIDFEAWEKENGLSDVIATPFDWEKKFDKRCETFA